MEMEGSALTLEAITLAELLDSYLHEHLVRPATAETYRKAVKRWIEETAILYVDGVTREAVLAWRNGILRRARPETWNKYRRHMRALFNHALGRGWTSSNPFQEVPPARTGQRLKKTVGAELVRRAVRLLESSEEKLRPGWFWAMVVRAFYFTGIRRRQLVELRWGDVDLDAGVWRIRAETSKTHREWFVPLAHEVVEDLKELRVRVYQQTARYPSRTDQVYNVTLFYPRYRGPRMREDQVGGFFHRLSVELGAAERITPHRLRHTMATLLAAEGDLRTLQELLGHTNIGTTMDYVHPDVEHMRSLVMRLPRL